jgi:hypothetical protein
VRGGDGAVGGDRRDGGVAVYLDVAEVLIENDE